MHHPFQICSRPVEDSPEGICFSIPTDSEDDDEEELNWLPPVSSPKGKGAWVDGRHRSASPGRRSGSFIADARQSLQVERPTARSRSTPLVDEDGFQTVVYKRHSRAMLRQPRRPIPRRPVPKDLVGRCFNCLAYDHVASQYTQPSRCLRCEKV